MTGAVVTLTSDEQQHVSAKVKDAFYAARDQGRTMHQAAEDVRIYAAVEGIVTDRLNALQGGPVGCVPIERASTDGFWINCACGYNDPAVWSTLTGAREVYLSHVVRQVSEAADWLGSVDVDYREDYA